MTTTVDSFNSETVVSDAESLSGQRTLAKTNDDDDCHHETTTKTTTATTPTTTASSSPHPPPHLENDKADLEKSLTAEEEAHQRQDGHHQSNSTSSREANVLWDDANDPEYPPNFSTFKKLTTMFVICTASICVTSASSMVSSTYSQMEEEFNISSVVSALGLTMFVFGLGLGPLFLGPLSEFYGRNLIYRSSYFLFCCFILPVALAKNLQTWLIGRFFGGVCGAAFLSVAGGSVADMFLPHKVALPMAIYTMCPFLGPSLGPMIAGFICQYTSWRWTWWTLLIWSGVEFAGLMFLVPETFGPALLKRKAKKLRKLHNDPNYLAPLDLDTRSVPKVILWSCGRPFQILLLEPMALLLCTWTALLLGILYGFFESYPLVFGPGGHNFSPGFIGLSFAGIGVGSILGTATFPMWRRINAHYAAKTPDVPPGPEQFLRQAMLGGLLVPAGMLWFAFTTYRSIHWIVPLLGSVLFGMGCILVFGAVFTYLVSAYRPYAASAMAANSFLRSGFAAAFPLFVVQSYHRLGNDWATAMYGFMTLALAPLPFIFYRIGARLRQKSRFSGTPSK